MTSAGSWWRRPVHQRDRRHPSTDVGAIDVDGGVTVRMIRSGGEGPPGLPEPVYPAYVGEDCEVEFNGPEYNPEQCASRWVPGSTSYSSTSETYSSVATAVTTCAIHIRHEMLSGMTPNCYV